jgi:prephenate dehydrogenase
VRVIGTGLIGGSLGLALTAAGVDVQVEDLSPGTLALAVELGVGHVPGPEDPAPQLVVVAAPPDVTAQVVAQALREHPLAMVVDVASVKTTVLEDLAALQDAGELTPGDLRRYIGAHPMAGREVSGVIAARADIFPGRPFVIVPHPDSETRGIQMLKAIATDLGSLPSIMDAATHDAAVAHVSHVPQVLSSLLASTLLDAEPQALNLVGQGLRDTTRIASSDPRLWVEILGANAEAIGPVLESARDRLDAVIDALALVKAPKEGQDDRSSEAGPGPRRTIAGLIADGNQGVARIPGKHGGGTDSFVTVQVLVPDRPGELGRLLTEMGVIGVNLEEIRLEHSIGQKTGVAHIAVELGREALLTRELERRGWTVAGTDGPVS